MSSRRSMLQVARLAPRQLGESRDLVASFLRGQLNHDGGFRDRTGASDLYYTVFGLDGLVALQETLPVEPVHAYLRRFGDGGGIDFVHLACLARCWANVSRHLEEVPASAILARLEAHRAADGGYAPAPGASVGTAYATFLALGAYEDLQQPVPQPEQLAGAVLQLRARDGGFANRPDEPHGVTTVTAAAVAALKTLGAAVEPGLGMWLLDRCHRSGGFFAAPQAPVPDLLSTATALHALSLLSVPLSGLQEPCLDFVDSLWTNRGGFYGSWLDETVDCEYTYYGLLALGHLTVATAA